MLADDSRFGLIVIGGGINGAAIAREAALSGIEVLLVERDDFCAGTSAASTRLIHGGLRYLEHGEFSLVRESLREREQLLAAAPHLVEPLEIVLPLYRRSKRGPAAIRLGMWLYDLLSWGKSLPGHTMLSQGDVLRRLPGIDAAGLRGGAAYFDAQVAFPERLVVEIVLDAVAAGATVQTKTESAEILVENGTVSGIVWRCGERNGVARASVVVNAAGPWVDAVLGRHADRRLIGGTRGSHLVTRPFQGAPSTAVYAEAESDGRPFFVVPWNGMYLIGTTDERDSGNPQDARMDHDEYDYLVAETRRLFPQATDLAESVCYTFAGIRPLPDTQGIRTGAITRKHMIEAHPDISGLVSVVGGKLTTHRSLAVDCLTELRRWLPIKATSPSLDRPLPGTLAEDERQSLMDELGSIFGIRAARRMGRTYGGLARKLLQRASDAPELRAALKGDGSLTVAELVYAMEKEWATTLVDLLQRRTMVGLDADIGLETAPLAADALVRIGAWDEQRASDELRDYRRFTDRLKTPA